MHHGGFYAEDTCLKNHSIAAGETARNSPSPLPKCVNGDKAITNDLSELSEEKDSLSLDPTADIAASPPLGPQQSTHETGNHSDDNNEDDDADYEFPEGGFQAWLVVFGSFCAMFMVFGVVNSTAALQDYFSNHQLRGYSPGSIGWIFSLNLFLVFFCGLYIGGIFDVHGPRLLVAFGSLALVLSMMLLGFCTEYWQFMLDYAVLGGIGGALLNTPAYASIGHFFQRRRGLATGVACTSGSIGGIVIPVMLQGLIPKIGFAWSTRVIGFLFLLLAVPANLFIVKRLPPSKKASGSLLPDLTAFKDPSFALCSAGMFLMEWGLFVPLTYISSYCTTHGQDPSFGFTAVALLNSGSFFGRWLPGLLADKLGRFNVIIVTILLCAITVLAIWLPAADSRAVIIVFAISFGFASGSNLGLIPVCLSQLCRAEDYGRYFATSYFFASFG
ncbi:MFS general substrate transporter [Xylona heveae TC161]|uniref:MFS general substrate transporter n=1 Tax=Xylona heveae (strain CBS 132557 / TC161) TaxID=1328760 RepID=A0A165IBC1_XYLHT|nr:MFS general substrate transporter [Xylona heveae TC161]KZF24660.1 MFS general substrate transporter [Xylona heveae TC161]